LNHCEPESGKKYKIGVVYFNDHEFGESTACINIWIWQNLVFNECVKLIECDFWEVAYVEWPSGAVDKIYNKEGKPKIINNCNPPEPGT